MPITKRPLLRSTRSSQICADCLRRLSSTPTSRASAGEPTSLFASYEETSPPGAAQLSYASNLFLSRHDRQNKPTHLLNAPRFLQLPPSPFPEVAIIGRSNVGKSSLLNALLGFNATTSSKTKGGAHVSRRAGATVDMNVFGVGGVVRRAESVGMSLGTGKTPNRWRLVGNEGQGHKLIVLDMPGYASGSTLAQGKEIVKYLTGRKQLRRVFVLIDSRHGMKKSDKDILTLLWVNSIPHQLVLSKVDYIVMPRHTPNWEKLKEGFESLRKVAADHYRELRDGRRRTGTEMSRDVLATSSEKSWPPTSGERLGVAGLRWAILQAVGLESGADGRRRVLDLDLLTEDE